MTQNDLPYWLAASALHIDTKTFLYALKPFPNIKNLFDSSLEDLIGSGFSPTASHSIKNINWTPIQTALRWNEVPHHHLLTYPDPSYPPLLREIPDPPLVLYLHGNKSTLTTPQLALVGSRNPTPFGQKTAEQFACALAEQGLTITSGLALGIDAASHKGALAAQGKTIAVFGTGLQHIYPASHRFLAQKIIEGEGALISEFPLLARAQKWHFPMRNRLISGLSLGVLVIEAALKSGSLVTARHASEQGREVFAIPGSIHNPLSRGCHHLIRQGAKLVETVTDILEELPGFSPPHRPAVHPQQSNLHPIAAKLLRHIGFEVTPMDQIFYNSGLTQPQVSSILLTLELEGYIQVVAGGYIRC